MLTCALVSPKEDQASRSATQWKRTNYHVSGEDRARNKHVASVHEKPSGSDIPEYLECSSPCRIPVEFMSKDPSRFGR